MSKKLNEYIEIICDGSVGVSKEFIIVCNFLLNIQSKLIALIELELPGSIFGIFLLSNEI